MDRRTKDTLRGAATALGVATGLLGLASTAQTPDGYIHASFGGPLDVFSSNSNTDVLAIDDGANDATELATLLKGPVGPAAKDGAADSPYRVAYEAGAAPNATTGAATVMPSSEPLVPALGGKDPAILPAKPVVDAQGRIDCTGAVSCKTDPATNTTTVTYPDGVIAIVQKINDLTVVAYKTITEALPSEIATLLPPPPAPPVLQAVGPTAASTPSAVSPVPTSVPETTSAPATNPPVRDTVKAPDIPTLPTAVTPTKQPSHSGTGSTAPTPNVPNKVKDALDGITDTIKGAVGAVGKALNPGASTTPGDSSQSGTGASTKPEDSTQSGNSGASSPAKPATGEKPN